MMFQEIYVIDKDKKISERLAEIFSNDKEYKVKQVMASDINMVLKNIPSLIIVNEDALGEETKNICKTIDENEDNTITPVIVISSNKDGNHVVELLKLHVVHYVQQPLDEAYLYYIMKNMLRLLYINRRVSPLTGLPGNVQIQAEIKKRLLNKELFAMLYLDLDNFKAYNDVYGFLKGDEIIKFTARTILQNIHSEECDNSFVGHIGGDDFVAIVGKANYEKVCQKIIMEFDKEVKKYFTENDVQNGYIQVANRKGIIEEFPLTSISIGVVIVDRGRFRNTLEIGEAGASVNHLAKTIQGSSYVIDRRKAKI